MNRENENSKSEVGIVITKRNLVIIILVFLLLFIGGFTLAFNWNNWFGDQSDNLQSVSVDTESSKPGIDIDPNAGDWNGSKPEDKGEEEVGIKIPGYPSITIEKDTKDVTMALLNPEGNPCYFKFEIVLKETEETIFTSKHVPPGQAITDVALTRPLSEGEYEATIKITTIALDGETPLNGANVETVLTVK